MEIYIVGTQGVQVADMARQTGLAATHAVEDTEGVLSDTYHPATLTAVLVDVDGSVAEVARDRGKGFQPDGPDAVRWSRIRAAPARRASRPAPPAASTAPPGTLCGVHYPASDFLTRRRARRDPQQPRRAVARPRRGGGGRRGARDRRM